MRPPGKRCSCRFQLSIVAAAHASSQAGKLLALELVVKVLQNPAHK
jgi:hypothetical protein